MSVCSNVSNVCVRVGTLVCEWQPVWQLLPVGSVVSVWSRHQWANIAYAFCAAAATAAAAAVVGCCSSCNWLLLVFKLLSVRKLMVSKVYVCVCVRSMSDMGYLQRHVELVCSCWFLNLSVNSE